MTGIKCEQCGALVGGLVCGYCGAVPGSVGGIDEQQRALEQYHALLRSRDRNTRIRLLGSGFLPDYSKLLIDAGLTCVSLIDDFGFGVSDAAAQRLEAIIMKLRLLPQDRETQKAIALLQEKSDQHKARSEKDTTRGLIAIAVFISLLIAFAVWYFRS